MNSELVDRDFIARTCPLLDLDCGHDMPVLGALWHPPGAIARHDAVAWAYARGAERHGVEIHQHTRVTSLRLAGDRVTGVETDRGLVETDRVVSAVAGYTPAITAMAGLKTPLVIHPLQACVTEPLKPWLHVIVVSGSFHIYVSQSSRGEMVMGASLDPYEVHSTRSTLEFAEGLSAHVLAVFPHLGGVKVLRQWAGLADMTPDFSPIMGLTPVEGFFLDAGWGTWGFKATPASGSTMAWTVAHGRPHPLIESFRAVAVRGVRAGGREGGGLRRSLSWSTWHEAAALSGQRRTAVAGIRLWGRVPPAARSGRRLGRALGVVRLRSRGRRRPAARVVVSRAQRHLVHRGARHRHRSCRAHLPAGPIGMSAPTDRRLAPQPGEWIDRSRPIAFRFEGRRYRGLHGDTVSSALLAAGVRVLGRSFKYHRPRGVFSLTGADANVMLEGAAGTNLRGDETPLTAGLDLRAVNTLGGVRRDLLAVLGRLAAFTPVGFYYKAMHTPRALFPLYERGLRKLAGLGRVRADQRQPPSPKDYGFCDVLVVGAGRAGVAAANAAAACGAAVLLVESDERLDRCVSESIGSAVDCRFGTTCVGIYADLWAALVDARRLTKVRARSLVLASGCEDQPAVFGNNDLPGVMLGQAARRLMERYAVRPADRPLVFTAGTTAVGWRRP